MATAAAISGGLSLGSTLIGTIGQGVNNSLNNQNRLDLQHNAFDFQRSMLGYQNDARLGYLERLSSKFANMGLPPVLAYGPLNPYDSVRYRTGLNYSGPQQMGYNGSSLFGFATPQNFN